MGLRHNHSPLNDDKAKRDSRLSLPAIPTREIGDLGPTQLKPASGRHDDPRLALNNQSSSSRIALKVEFSVCVALNYPFSQFITLKEIFPAVWFVMRGSNFF